MPSRNNKRIAKIVDLDKYKYATSEFETIKEEMCTTHASPVMAVDYLKQSLEIDMDYEDQIDYLAVVAKDLDDAEAEVMSSDGRILHRCVGFVDYWM